MYYPRASAPDLVLEESSQIQQRKYNVNSIFEWNIDGISDYNIITVLQQMTMVSNTYRTKHNSTNQVIAQLLVAGFTGSLKSWWDSHLQDQN